MGLYQGYLLFEIPFLLWIPVSPTALCANYTVTLVPSELIAIRGENITLKCPFSIVAGQPSSAKGAMTWYKGLRGAESVLVTGPRFSLIYPDSFLSPGEGLLVITNVSLEDAGTYTCQIMVWGEGEARGNGIQLHVYASPSNPLIFLQLQTEPVAKWTLLCRTSGFYPASVKLSWSQTGLKLPSSQHECTDSTASHQASSLLDLQNPDQRTSYVCTVEHPSLLKPLSVRYDYEPQFQVQLPPKMIQFLNLMKIGVITAISIGLFTGACINHRKKHSSRPPVGKATTLQRT